MKAYIIDRYGKKNTGRMGEFPEPTMHDDDVLVQVHAASVNLLDAKIRNGEFRLILPYRLPLVLGNDVAGVVVRVGAGVKRFKPGDEVYARPEQARIGAFAEWIAVPEDALALKPHHLSMEEAASLPLVSLTAWQTLVEAAGLKKGQKCQYRSNSGPPCQSKTDPPPMIYSRASAFNFFWIWPLFSLSFSR